ncbi:MAG: hypothetical protein LW630_05475 [Saprospiraceae bacterium]|nr:hypothetical protein [Saprospiraceae bacterium]
MSMSQIYTTPRTQAQISRAAIQRLYVSMRHLFLRGMYKPLGVSGESMIEAMLLLKPEIYGSVADEEKVELDGLLYVFQRLPKGIEQCRYIKLISREGYSHSHFEKHVPPRRKRDCYRVDEEQMFIEMTRGSSDIYDILTHLTFLYIEAEKIRKNSLDSRGMHSRGWLMLEGLVKDIQAGKEINREVGYTYLNTILGRTYDEVERAYTRFEKSAEVNDLFTVTYWMGKLSMDEFFTQVDREISFSPALRESLGHHVYGEKWANSIKEVLWSHHLFDRPLHIISANLHSVMNCFYARAALAKKVKSTQMEQFAEMLSLDENAEMRAAVEKYALQHGMILLTDTSGTNIGVQLFDTARMNPEWLPEELQGINFDKKNAPVIMVMDYAFGEQAYETMDELLKPYVLDDKRHHMHVESINIMGKAGILEGGKGDIMIPTAHVFEGTADNYPLENALSVADFADCGLGVYEGSMITVLGTSLQNKDILTYFLKSSWKAIGLEMEGAHYQKAIQAAMCIRHNIRHEVRLRYAYYASDNPLETGSTLASGSLGLDGVRPTYLITLAMLRGCLT